MFSSITIASSTTKPMERMSAIIERLSRVKPSTSITANVPRMENGSASAGNQRRRAVVQEREDHRRPRAASVMSIVHWMSLERLADVARAVAADLEVDRRRQLALERRQQRADRVGDLDGVAAGLPHHLQVDRAPARRPSCRATRRSCCPRRCRGRWRPGRAGPARRCGRRR